jgi:hypothetical protein
MYLVVIAWTYVVVMMAVVEATSSQGTVLGALVTFVLYGVVPVTLVVYLMGTPARRRALRAREAAERAQTQPDSNAAPDARSHATTDAVAPMRKEP